MASALTATLVFCQFPPHPHATILQLPHLFTKEVAEGAVALAAGTTKAAEAWAATPVAAREDLEVEEIKKLGEGAAWRWGESADDACRQGGTQWYHQGTIVAKEVRWRRTLTSPSPPMSGRVGRSLWPSVLPCLFNEGMGCTITTRDNYAMTEW